MLRRTCVQPAQKVNRCGTLVQETSFRELLQMKHQSLNFGVAQAVRGHNKSGQNETKESDVSQAV
jgi:hypothetical protein